MMAKMKNIISIQMQNVYLFSGILNVNDIISVSGFLKEILILCICLG